MLSNCYGVPVPPVPESPIDLEKPAYVLVDGRWVDMGEIISRYVPPPIEGGVVLQIRHVTVAAETLPGLLTTDPEPIHAVTVVEPSNASSRLVVTGSVSYASRVQDGISRWYTFYFGARHETSTGNYDVDDRWHVEGVRNAGQFPAGTNASNSNVFAFQHDFGPAQRRSDDGKWGISVWGLNNATGFINAPTSNLQLTLTEYMPS